jgi:uncharacterized protein
VSLVEVRVNGLVVEQKAQQNIVILRESDGVRILPIWIGPGEAHAIRRLLAEEPFPRPLTHDLLHAVVEGLQGRIARVVIAELKENTFYANVMVEHGGEVLAVDSRPSDAIAIALRAQAPIFVNETLLMPPPSEEAEPSEAPDEPAPPTAEDQAEQLRRYLEKLDPEDFGKFRM